MNRMQRAIAVGGVAALLGGAASPASAARHYTYRYDGGDAGHEAGEAALITLGALTGLAVLVGGSIWYYVHHRRAEQAAAAPVPSPTE